MADLRTAAVSVLASIAVLRLSGQSVEAPISSGLFRQWATRDVWPEDHGRDIRFRWVGGGARRLQNETMSQ
jgi:hypothetical protein